MNIIKLLNVKNITIFLIIATSYFLYLLSFSSFELYQISKFNESLKKGEAPQQFEQGYEARFSTAFRLQKRVILKRPLYFLIIYLKKERMIKNQLFIIISVIFTLKGVFL